MIFSASKKDAFVIEHFPDDDLNWMSAKPENILFELMVGIIVRWSVFLKAIHFESKKL